MKKFGGYETTQAYDGDFEVLPLGGHYCEIKGVKMENYAWGDMLVLYLDIADGDNKGFFTRQYNRKKQQNPDAKWPCTYRQGVPKDDGSEKDNKTKGFFKGMVSCVEKSNPGYVWNWEEKTLTGKKIGGVFGQEEFVASDGTVKLATKCVFVRSYEAIKNGVDIPAIKKLKEGMAPPLPEEPNTLPFDI